MKRLSGALLLLALFCPVPSLALAWGNQYAFIAIPDQSGLTLGYVIDQENGNVWRLTRNQTLVPVPYEIHPSADNKKPQFPALSFTPRTWWEKIYYRIKSIFSGGSHGANSKNLIPPPKSSEFIFNPGTGRLEPADKERQ